MYYFRKRPSVKELLDHPWLTTKAQLTTQTISTINQPEIITITTTPKSTPIAQPKIPKKSYNNDNVNGSYTGTPVRTYTSNYSCPQCGTTCRHLSHSPVTKSPITVDRGILC